MHRSFLLVLLAAGALGSVRAQSPLAELPAGYDSVLVVRDVLPSLEAALGSDVLASPVVREQLEGAGVDLGAVRAGLALFARQVPVEIVVAAPPQAIGAFAHALGAVVALLVLAEDAGDEEAAAQLRVHVAGLGDLALVGHVRARDADIAEAWFDALTDLLDALPADDGLRATISGDTIDLVVEPLRLQGGRALARFGVPAAAVPEPPRLEVQVRRDGARIGVRVGKAAEGRLAVDALGRLPRDTPEQLLFARLNATSMLAVTGAVLEFMEAREDAIEAAVERRPEIGLMLESMSSRLAMADPLTTYALNLIDGGVELLDNTDFGEGFGSEPLPPGGVLGFVDPALTAFGATSIELDLLVHVLLEQLREQALNRAARDELQERVTFAGRLLAFCDDDLMPLREFFGGEASAVFVPGTVIVLEGASEVTSIAVTAPSGDAEAKLDGARLPAVALLGLLAEDADPWQFALACSASTLAAFGPREAPLALEEADLGLGVPTRVVPWSALAPAGRGLAVGGDLQPHWFVHGGALAFSTSPSLSRRLLTRHGAAQVAPPAGIMGWWRYSGAAFADAVEQVTAAVAHFADPKLASVRAALGIESELAGADALRTVGEVVAALARRIERIEMLQRIDGRYYDDRITVMWGRR